MDVSCADFYIGVDDKSIYLGSVLRNGSIYYIPLVIFTASTPSEYEYYINCYLENNELKPFKVWPHIWPDSSGTDFSYWFYNGRVYCCCSEISTDLFDPINYFRCGSLEDSFINIKPKFPKMAQ